MLQLLGTTNSTTGFLFNIQNSVSVKGFVLKFSSTANQTATAVLPADVGRVRCWFRNYPIYDLNFDCLQAFSEVNGGFVDTSSTASSTFNFTSYIPVSWNDNNVLYITPQDTMRWENTFTTAARFANGTLTELYGVVENGVQAYTLTMQQLSESLAASQYLVKTYPYENIVASYFSDIVSSVFTLASSPISRVKATLGDRVSDATVSAWLDYTRLTNRREATYSLIAEIFGSDIGSFGSPNRLKNDLTVAWQNGSGGAAVAQLLLVGQLLNPNKLADTSARVLAELQQDIRNKNAGGYDRTVQTLGATGQLPSGV